MHKTDFKELKMVPEQVCELAKGLAANAAHLAKILKSDTYLGRSSANGTEAIGS